MSSFVVEDEIINSVVNFLSKYRVHGSYLFLEDVNAETGCNLETAEGRTALGNAMFALNCNAVEQRYGAGEAKEFRALDYQYRSTIPPTLIQAYKSLSCWRYQCAEGDVPESSLLYAAMGRVWTKWPMRLYGHCQHTIRLSGSFGTDLKLLP